MHSNILSILGKTFEFKTDKVLCTTEDKVFYEWRAGDKCRVSGLNVEPSMGGSLENPLICITPESDDLELWEIPYSNLPSVLSAL